MKITYDYADKETKYLGIKFQDDRAWNNITVTKLAEGVKGGIPVWQPATIQVQNHTLTQPDTYVLVAAIQLALAEAAKLDVRYPVGTQLKEEAK